MYDGIINVYKEPGFTSFDVCAKLRGILHQKKIGHTGTLDPMATGVLPVCLGKATKLAGLLTDKDKEYRAVIRFGSATDTEDITGEVISSVSEEEVYKLSDEMINEAIRSFIGSYDQLPPMYSAIKKDGKKLYEYARAGIAVEREKRPVTIHAISDVRIDLPDVSFDVHCSKGTYIRSLVRDIGEKMGVPATLEALTRSRVKDFHLSEAKKLSEIEDALREGSIDSLILPTDALLTEYKKITVLESGTKLLQNGNKLPEDLISSQEGNYVNEQIYRVYMKDTFTALYMYHESEKSFHPYKMFL